MAFEYVPNFLEDGGVSLLVKHPDPAKDELLKFNDYDDMEACAIARPYIPMETWETLSAMYLENQAKVNPVNIF